MFDFQPRLESDAVILRPAREADFDALHAIAADPAIWALHPASDRWQGPVFRAFLDGALADEGGLVAIEPASGAVIGFSRYSVKRCQPGEVEIGWTFLARRCWGGAVNGAMKRLMIDHAFRFVDTVLFFIGADNLRSRRAVEKIGAQLTGRTIDPVMDGQIRHHLCYAMERQG